MLADCSCSLHVDNNGNGKCRKPFSGLNNKFACYVNEPTTCSDVKHVDLGQSQRKISAQACQETQGNNFNNIQFEFKDK